MIRDALSQARTISLALTVNGRDVSAQVEPRTHLADFLREDLNLTGTHLGCEHGVCGACTVLLDGEPARSCLTFAATCSSANVVTIEGLDDDDVTAGLRAAFNREHALQCGFCTPGMLVSARDLVLRLRDPDERQIRIGLAGNLCRCTGYVGIVRAIQSVIAERNAAAGDLQPSGRRLGPVGAHPSRTQVGHAPVVPVRPAPAAAPLIAVQEFTPAQSFEQRFRIACAPDRVFALFGDVRAVAACLPGAFVDALPAQDRVEGGIRVRVGPISAAFRGAASIERDEAARAGRILGAGTDGRSAAQGEIRYSVGEGAEPSTSEVILLVGYTLKGPLAQFGRPSLVRDIASRLTSAFATNLEAQVLGLTPPAAAASTLNPARLVLELVVAWTRRQVQRLRGEIGRLE